MCEFFFFLVVFWRVHAPIFIETCTRFSRLQFYLKRRQMSTRTIFKLSFDREKRRRKTNENFYRNLSSITAFFCGSSKMCSPYIIINIRQVPCFFSYCESHRVHSTQNNCLDAAMLKFTRARSKSKTNLHQNTITMPKQSAFRINAF